MEPGIVEASSVAKIIHGVVGGSGAVLQLLSKSAARARVRFT